MVSNGIDGPGDKQDKADETSNQQTRQGMNVESNLQALMTGLSVVTWLKSIKLGLLVLFVLLAQFARIDISMFSHGCNVLVLQGIAERRSRDSRAAMLVRSACCSVSQVGDFDSLAWRKRY